MNVRQLEGKLYLCCDILQDIYMGRKSSATIRFVQKMNRQMKDESYPIYIVVCFGGRVEKATGVSCLVKYWDSKREEIKRGCPNAPVLNKMLSDIKTRIIERKNEYEFHQKVYTPAMLMEDAVIDLNGKSNVFKDIMDELVRNRRLKTKTSNAYRYAYDKVVEFSGKEKILVNEITLGFIKDFVRWLNLGDGTVRGILGSIASVWNYSIDKGLVDAKDYPFREWKFTQKYKQKPRDYYLDKSHIIKLMDYWLNLVIVRNGNMWHYKDGAYEKLGDRNSEEFGILWFLLMYKMNGSAPVEITKLKVDMCQRITINGEDYWAVNFKRQKTDVEVRIRWKRDMFCIIGLEHFLGRSTDGYVYPIKMKDTVDEWKMLKDSWHCSENAIKWVRKAFKKINEETIRKNVNEGCNEPLVEVERVVMYTARHSFSNNMLSTPGISVRDLASMLSRSPNTISTYIKQLTRDEDIAELSKNIPI